MPNLDELLAAATSALSQHGPAQLGAATELGGSSRSAVYRVAVRGDGLPASAILKAYPEEHRERFIAEAAGLAFCDAGPALLGADPATRLVVMEDLGTHPGLADLLLGADPGRAWDAAIAWATSLGRLCAGSRDREAGFRALRQRFGGESHDPSPARTWLPGMLVELRSGLVELGVKLPPDLDAEFADLLAAVEPGEYAVFSPGDACPDNNLLTEDGLRFIDFESAGYHSVFLDAAYARLPFATCWCVLTPPPGLTRAMEAAFRAEVVGAFPALADDSVWDRGVRRACAAWALAMSAWRLPMAVKGGLVSVASGAPAPTHRAYLAHRWRWLADELEHAGDLPAVAALVRAALSRAGQLWPDEPHELPPYPAFASSSARLASDCVRAR